VGFSSFSFLIKDNLLSAISFASFHYRNKFEDGIPCINQFIEISMILNGKGSIKDEKLLRAAVLVNIVNDTHVRIKSIEMLFGKDVRMIVEILTYNLHK
jgi:(p)ppGpp synthase/HD superfamily hydrolase